LAFRWGINQRRRSRQEKCEAERTSSATLSIRTWLRRVTSTVAFIIRGGHLLAAACPRVLHHLGRDWQDNGREGNRDHSKEHQLQRRWHCHDTTAHGVPRQSRPPLHMSAFTLHAEHHAETGLAAHHSLVSICRLFQRKNFIHRLDSAQRTEPERILRINRGAGVPAFN